MRDLTWLPDLNLDAGPKYRVIADALMRDVESGLLKPGAKMPPQRELAWRLGVTVGTVTRAYQEAEYRGFVAGEVGRGTFVRAHRDHNRRPSTPLWDWHMMDPPPEDGGDGPINMHFNFPPVGLELEAARSTLTSLANERGLFECLTYQSPTGNRRQGEAGARWLARRGVQADSEDIVICAGAHNGILVVLASISKPGDRILTEELCYPGLRPIARMLGLELVPIAMDREGLCPDALRENCALPRIAAIYCVPTLQNPTNVTMSENRRAEVASIAIKAGIPLIEDDIFGLMPEDAPAALSAHAPDSSYYITSVSKTLSPGLRVGFVRPPRRNRDAVAAAVRASAWMASPLTTEIAVNWIMSGAADDILADRRRLVCERQKILRAALPNQDADLPDGALHAWLHLPEPWRASQFVAAAAREDVVLSAAHAFTVGRGQLPHAVRVCLGPARNVRSLEDAVRRLAHILDTRDPLEDSHVM